MTTANVPSRAQPEPTVYAIGLTEEQLLAVSVAVSKLGLGFRSYTTIAMARRDLPPNPAGCVFLPIGPRDSTTELLQQLQPSPSLSIIAIVPGGSLEDAASLVRSGIHDVISPPFVNEKLAASIRSAVGESQQRRSIVDGGADAARRMKEATAKELEVLELIISGHKNKEIAVELGITIRAVEDRRGRLMRKVGVESVAELVVLAVTARYFEQGFQGIGTFDSDGNTTPDTPSTDAATATTVTSGLATTGSCLRGIEIWGKSEATQELTLLQSVYSDSDSFIDATEGVTFYRGEGLPGKVWNQRAPVFMHALAQPDFVRSSAARKVRIDAALGIPLFRRQHVAEVMVLLLENRDQTTAAFEAWRVDPQTERLQLADGHYLNCPYTESLSAYLQYPAGKGFPGITAESARPQFRVPPVETNGIVRAPALLADKLTSFVGLPLTDSGSIFSDVFVVMNGDSSPVFTFVQTWVTDGSMLQLTDESINGERTSETLLASETAGLGTIQHHCRESGRAIIAKSDDSRMVAMTRSVPLSYAIAIPTFIQNSVVAVTVLGNVQNP